MKINDILTLDVIDLTDEGTSVAKVDNLTVFLDKAVIGDKVKAKVVKVKKNYIVAKVEQILKKSEIREPKQICSIQNICGGCQILNIKYSEQLKIKKDFVIQKLKRIGNIENPPVKDVIGMDEPFRYRNKTQMPLGKKGKNSVVGFYKQKSHEIVPFKDCVIQDDANNKIIEIIKEYIQEENIEIYDEIKHKGNLRHIITKFSKYKDEIMLILVTNYKERLKVNRLVKKFEKENINIKSIIQNINNKKTNVIMSNENIILYGNEYITDMIEDLHFRIYPNSFYQVNPVQMEKMYQKAIEYSEVTENDTVYDLYCGIGTISLLFAKRAKKVYGIEVVEQAVKSARENSEINNIKNAEFFANKVEDEIENLADTREKPDIVVLDPARKGCKENVLETILKVSPRKIVYISCNPSTLARDLEVLLKDEKYKLDEVQPYDLFPHTMHIENVALLTKTDVE